MHFAYLSVLVISLAGLAIIDARYRLILWRDPGAAIWTLAAGLAFFVLWDATGIALHIFYPGSSAYATGLLLAPGFPIEELLFLSLLSYLTLILWEARR